MNSGGRIAALLLSVLGCMATQSVADTMTPYQAVLLDWQKESVLIVDMDTGSHMEIPVEVPEISAFPGAIAVDSDGAIFVYYGFFLDETGPVGSLMARLDPTLSEWTTMRIEGENDFPDDMAFTPDGNLIVGAEFGLYDLDLTDKKIRVSRFQPSGEYDRDGATIGIEIDSSGTVVYGALKQSSDETILFRQNPEAEFPERFEPGVPLKDFILDSDGSLIGVWHDGTGFTKRALYRLDFDTNAVDVLFESDLLRGTEKIKFDPDGRIVAMSQIGNTTGRIVLVDLELGTAEVIAEFEADYLSDMELRIIPEPSSIMLLVLGIISFILLRHSHRRMR